MAGLGITGVRASFSDAKLQLVSTERADPPADQPRDGIDPGHWPGHPVDRLPPQCPVIPLGKDGDRSYFVDTLGQLRSVEVNKWGKKILIDLFAEVPNYLTWSWPRLGKMRSDGSFPINGLEVDDAVQCLLKACARRGLFTPTDRVRGRGAWQVANTGELIWHSGDRLWRIEGRKLTHTPAGCEIDGVFYQRRPPLMRPWLEPITHEAGSTPAHDLFRAFRTWQWERPALDPILLLAWIGCAIIGGALEWRPSSFITGDRGQGKSTLQAMVKGIIGDALHQASDTTPAGIYQRVGHDTLPVAVDEFEADGDNRRARGVLALARLASSGSVMFRGGAEHQAVEFQARNTFLFSAINPPPMEPAERSRMAILNLRKLDQGGRQPELSGTLDSYGRMILRQLMDGWATFPACLDMWRSAMRDAGLDGRTQDTYGTLLAVANVLLGDEAMEAAGIPISEAWMLGDFVATATAAERAEQTDNWRGCLEHLLGSTIDAWRGGEKPTIGGVMELLERDQNAIEETGDPLGNARARLAAAGLGLYANPALAPGPLLAVPGSSPQLARLFQGSKWAEGVWTHALKQAPAEVVLRSWKPGVVKINRAATRCVLVNLKAYDVVTEVT